MRVPDPIPAEQLTSHASDDMLLFTAALSIIIGIILTWMGKMGRQQWLFVWGIGLVICSLALGYAIINH